MAQRSFSILSAVAVVALTSCSAEYPYKQVQFCLSEIDDINEVNSTLQGVARDRELTFIDSSASVQRDLETIESPLRAHVIYMEISDPKWLSRNGPILISNIGAPSPRSVRVSFFKPGSVFYSGAKTEQTAVSLIGALRQEWDLSDTTGQIGEGKSLLC